MISKITQNQIKVALLLIAVVGMRLFWVSTSSWGIGVEYDSVFYLSAADTFLAGEGLSWVDGNVAVPLTHFPPVYPLLLAFISFIFQTSTVVAARCLGFVLVGLLIYLFGWVILKLTDSNGYALLAALLCLTAPITWTINFLAMSEPLFILIALLIILAVWKYIQEEESKTIFLVLLGLTLGISYLIRYAGLTMVAFAGLGILFLGQNKLKKRLTALTIVAGATLLTVLPWLLRNLRLTGGLTNREMQVHMISKDQFLNAVDTLSQWFLPYQMPLTIRGIILLLLGLGITILFIGWAKNPKDRRTQKEYSFALLLVGFIIIYSGLLLVSLSFFDASTRLNDRILSPIYFTGLLLVLLMARFYITKYPTKLFKWLVLGGTIVFVAANVYSTGKAVAIMYTDGQFFTGREWQNSETIALINDLPEDIVLFSNESFPIYFLTGRRSTWIPELNDPVKNEPNQNYEREIETMRELISSGDGVMVIFFSIWDLPEGIYPTNDELSYGMARWQETSDAAIYAAPGWMP